MTIRNRLLHEVRNTRRRIQFERFLKGIAVTAAIALAASLVASYVLSQNNFSDTTILWSRILAGLACLGAFFKFVLWPLIRIPSAGAVARFLEERNPHLEDRLATAVESLGGPSSIHPAVRSLLLRDASRELASLDKPVLLYPQTSLISLLGFVVTGALFLFLQLSGPAAYPYSLDKLLGWADLGRPPLYSISVNPGNTRVVRHADLEIKAILQGFTSDEVLLVAKYESQPNWERARMRPDSEGPGNLFLFFDVREKINYFVEADGIRSDLFTVDVSEAPGIQELEIRLQYPRHTGLGESIQKDDGDMRALAGTQVRLQIRTDQPVQAGIVKFEESPDIFLQLSENDLLEGSFRVEHDDFYRIHLQNLESVWNAASDEYIVVSLLDQPPTVTLSRPGRDKRVTNLEEVFVEAEAEDDFGIRDMKLFFSVNGEPEESVGLEIGRYPRNTTASTTLYLEDFDLLPGDFISYYTKARDARSEAVTDIYFLEVLPYDREYSQSQQSGGAAGGGEDLRLARFQKEIIVATFNIVRDRQKLTPEELEEDIQTVAQMQEQMRQQAVTIKERIERRGAATDTPEFKQMVIYLTQAVEHMSNAHDQLKDSNLATALPHEQRAYQKLLRSEALFKEIQIAMSSGGSACGNSSAEDLADLVDLELDRTKNQYETLQQNRDTQRQQELNDLAEKLKELARRQQQEMERRRRQGMQSSSSGGGASQQQFMEELEELARRLEKLSRQQRDQQLNDISRELKQAARDLRQGQDSNAQSNQMRLQQALDRMQQAQEALDRQRRSDVRSGIAQLAQQAKRLREQQQDVVEELQDLERREKAGQKDQEWYQDAGRLAREKGGLQEEVLRLGSGLHQMARRIEPEEPEAAKQLKRAGLSVRDNRVAEKMQEGTDLLLRQWTMLARRREEGVEEHLGELAELIERAQEVLGAETQTSAQERSEEVLNRLGDLVENLEALRQRASAGQPQEQQQGDESSSEQGSPRQGDAQSQPSAQLQEGQQEPTPDGQRGQQGRARQGQPSSEGQSPQSQQAQSQQGQPQSNQSRQDGQRGVFGTQRPSGEASSLANSTGINPQQIGREWEERIQDAEKISGLLREIDPRRARDIAQLAREMRRIDASRFFNDPEEIQRLRSQIIDGFKQLELDLFRELARSEPDQLRLAYEEEIPPEYRSKVEEYYRKLAGEQD